MAGDPDDSAEVLDATIEPRECMACRGTGRVISKLGGEESLLACPWCSGSGVRQPGIDAQARWGEAPATGDEPE